MRKKGQRPEDVRCGDCAFFISDYYAGSSKNRGGCQAGPPGFGHGLGPDDGCGMFRVEWPESCGCKAKVMDEAGALAAVGNVDAAELLLHTARSLPECTS